MYLPPYTMHGEPFKSRCGGLAAEWLELQVVEALKPALQLPVGAPNDAKTMLPMTLPSGQPTCAIWSSAVSAHVPDMGARETTSICLTPYNT